jgi:hypothetical protein
MTIQNSAENPKENPAENPAENPEENISIPSKSLIFLKATTIAMGIVFVVLLIAFFLIKQKKSSPKISKCSDFLETEISGKIQEMTISGNYIIVLTEQNPKTKKQEIIKIDSKCSTIKNKIQFNAL